MKIVCMERSGLCDGYIPSMNTELQNTIDSMKSMAEHLLPYTFPNVPFEEEQQVLCLKQRSILVDGYELSVCFSKADYKKHILETLQIQSSHVPFIPFNVICKVGQLFMGQKELAYIDFFRFNRKVYCWATKNSGDRRLSPGNKSRPASYEGFDFHLLHPSTVDLF
jgi:hypothetical protein